jgi:transposase
MEYGAVDLHLRRSQVRIIDEQEQVVLDRRVDTTPADFERIFAGRARMRIPIESSTESEWVAQRLEGLGHEAVVVDPTYAAMYGSRSRKVKTDKRDVAALALANRRGVYRRAHRVPAATRTLRQQLRIRRWSSSGRGWISARCWCRRVGRFGIAAASAPRICATGSTDWRPAAAAGLPSSP